MARIHGNKGEDFFTQDLLDVGCTDYDFVDDWYDYDLYQQKIEVKSTQLTINSGKWWQIGRFDFTKVEQRDKAWEQNIWVCFIVRYRDQHLNLGMVQTKNLPKKRYITIHTVRKSKPISIKDWVEKYKY